MPTLRAELIEEFVDFLINVLVNLLGELLSLGEDRLGLLDDIGPAEIAAARRSEDPRRNDRDQACSYHVAVHPQRDLAPTSWLYSTPWSITAASA